MVEGAAAITAASHVAGSGATGGIYSIIIIFLLVVIPFIVKFWNWSKETSAQGELYKQLSETVQKQRAELDAVYSHKVILQEQLFELKSKVEKLESCEKTIDLLKSKLDQKDQIIAERDTRIAHLLEELLKMKDRVHNLEIRLKADEAKWCEGCKYKIQNDLQYIPNNLGDKHE